MRHHPGDTTTQVRYTCVTAFTLTRKEGPADLTRAYSCPHVSVRTPHLLTHACFPVLQQQHYSTVLNVTLGAEPPPGIAAGTFTFDTVTNKLLGAVQGDTTVRVSMWLQRRVSSSRVRVSSYSVRVSSSRVRVSSSSQGQ